jgi:hypothetical protein
MGIEDYELLYKRLPSAVFYTLKQGKTYKRQCVRCEGRSARWERETWKGEDNKLDTTWRTSEQKRTEEGDHASGVPGPTLMLLTPFRIPAPAAFVIDTPVDQILDFLGESLVSRVIDGPRIDSESK